MTSDLCRYAATELEELKRVQAEEDLAKAEIAKLRQRIGEAELAYYNRKGQVQKPNRSRVLAEAALAGKPPPPEPAEPPGPALGDLKATLEGLQEMLKDAEEKAGKAHGEVRIKTVELFRQAAERAAADYVPHAEEVGRLHAFISAMQEGLRFGGLTTIVGVDHWSRLDIPNSTVLGAMKGKGFLCFSRETLAGGDPSNCQQASAKAFQAVRSEITSLLKGRWPFDRG